MLVSIVRTSSAGQVTIPHTFQSGSKAMASHVNANFKALETSVNDNNSRITGLEGERSFTVFTLGEALSFLAESEGIADDILGKAQESYDSSLARYHVGTDGIDDIFRWSNSWLDIAYLRASDDAGRLIALEDHFQRMDALHTAVQASYEVGLVSISDTLRADYHLLLADALVEGFKVKTGQ